MKYAIAIFLSILSCNGAFSQFSMNDFLTGARNDIELFKNARKSEFLEKNPYRSPLLHRTEFRTRTNDLNITQDDFRFRINPTNPFEIKENNRYYRTEFDYLLTEYQYSLNRALNNRYELILSYLSTTQQKKLKETQIKILENELILLEADMHEADFALSDFIDLKEKKLSFKLELEEIGHRLEKIEFEIRSLYSFSGEIEMDLSDLVSLSTLKSWVDNYSPSLDTVDNILVENLVQQNRLEEQRIRVEKAEGRRNIGFIQAEYDRERGNELEDHMGFQVGVRLPLTNPDRPDMNRRRIELIEDKADVFERKMEVSLNCQLIRMEIDFLFDQYSLIMKEQADFNLMENISRMPDLRPEDIILVKKSELRLKRLEFQFRWDIYKSFIDYMYYSGKLIEVPLRNYLTETFEEI